MFKYSLDSKPEITDPKGNKIIDLAQSIFSVNAGNIQTYTLKRMAKHAIMRPDIVSQAEYGQTESAELILKYSGISNPFTLDEEDILLIPDEGEAINAMKAEHPEEGNNDSTSASEASIRNYFKFVNQDYKKDSGSYDALEAQEFKSAIPDDTISGDYVVPYIGDDTTAINIRNGRMYFGEDAGITANTVVSAATTNLDERIQALINSTATALSNSNCLYNGVTLADFVQAQTRKNTAAEQADRIRNDLENKYYEDLEDLME